MPHNSSVVIGGKLYTAYFAAHGLSYICCGKDGRRLWVSGWQIAPSKLALRVSRAFNVEIGE